MIGAIGEATGSNGWTDALGRGSVLGGCGASCCGTAPALLEEDFCKAAFARWVLNAPLLMRRDSDVEDARPTLSSSECCEFTTDGTAELRRVGGGMLGASWLDGPVDGESVILTVLSPEAVF